MSAFTFLFFSVALQAAEPINVDLQFFEALAPRDTTSSERFQKEYEGAISLAKTLLSTELAKCGYKISTTVNFYNASDSLEAFEKAKAASASAWMMVGPRRSNHYVLLAKGAPDVPSISTMASSREVRDLGNLHRTMAVFNDDAAKATAKEAKAHIKTKKPTYLTVVSEDCVACVDFSEQFDKAAKTLGYKKLKSFNVTGETPDLAKISAEVEKQKPNLILLPNYSKVTAQAISAFKKVSPASFYVGGDGWGDSNFGFLQNASDLNGSKGITIRSFPPAEKGLTNFKLGRDILKSSEAKPGSGSSLAVLKILDGLRDFLCEARPKTKQDFKNKFENQGKKYFLSPWGPSIYSLKDGDIQFTKVSKGGNR